MYFLTPQPIRELIQKNTQTAEERVIIVNIPCKSANKTIYRERGGKKSLRDAPLKVVGGEGSAL